MEKTIGDRVCEYAERKFGWTASELAQRVGVSYETVRKWRTGVTAPNRSRAMKLSEALGRSVEWVMHGTMERVAPPAPQADTNPAEQPESSDELYASTAPSAALWRQVADELALAAAQRKLMVNPLKFLAAVDVLADELVGQDAKSVVETVIKRLRLVT